MVKIKQPRVKKVSFNLLPSLYGKLQETATGQGVSISDVIRGMIIREIAKLKL